VFVLCVRINISEKNAVFLPFFFLENYESLVSLILGKVDLMILMRHSKEFKLILKIIIALLGPITEQYDGQIKIGMFWVTQRL